MDESRASSKLQGTNALGVRGSVRPCGWDKIQSGISVSEVGESGNVMSPILLTGEKRGLGSINMKVPSTPELSRTLKRLIRAIYPLWLGDNVLR